MWIEKFKRVIMLSCSPEALGELPVNCLLWSIAGWNALSFGSVYASMCVKEEPQINFRWLVSHLTNMARKHRQWKINARKNNTTIKYLFCGSSFKLHTWTGTTEMIWRKKKYFIWFFFVLLFSSFNWTLYKVQ